MIGRFRLSLATRPSRHRSCNGSYVMSYRRSAAPLSGRSDALSLECVSSARQLDNQSEQLVREIMTPVAVGAAVSVLLLLAQSYTAAAGGMRARKILQDPSDLSPSGGPQCPQGSAPCSIPPCSIWPCLAGWTAENDLCGCKCKCTPPLGAPGEEQHALQQLMQLSKVLCDLLVNINFKLTPHASMR